MILVPLLAYFAVLGGLMSYMDARQINEPQWLVMVTSIVGSLLVFWWYSTDSTSRSYRRSPLLNVAIIAIGIVAVPYYVLRSRERGKRLVAFAKLIGFALLAIVAMAIGVVLGLLVS